MTDNYLGEIRAFAFGIVPQGWALCNGAILNTQQNMALYSLIGNFYGGSAAQNTFALPNLMGRTPICSSSYLAINPQVPLGQSAGAETAVLNATNVPPHSHIVCAATVAGAKTLTSNFIAKTNSTATIRPFKNVAVTPVAPAVITIAPETVSTVGTSAAHNNMQPFLVVNYCIATTGLYPPRPY